MPSFSRDPHRFLASGVHLSAAKDTMPQGKWPFLQNVRSYQTGIIQPRFGHSVLYPLGVVPVHTVARLLDPTGLVASPSLVLAGAGSVVYAGHDVGSLTSAVTGTTGNPLSILSLQPPNSPNPWFYVADSNVMRKINANLTVYPIGTDSPVTEPSVVLYTIGVNLIAMFTTGLGSWASVGSAAGTISGAQVRVGTTVSAIYYDSGSTNSYVNIVPVDMTSIGEGMMLVINSPGPPTPGGDLIRVDQVCVAVASTTIGNIIYDSGSTGLCTIQPAASLGTGQLFVPLQPTSTELGGISSANAEVQSIISHTTPLTSSGLPNPKLFDPSKPTLSIRQIDYPLNCLVKLNGVETVRILSVATGLDGIQSFRCSTSGSFSAGQSIDGVASFRAWVPGTYTAGTRLDDWASAVTITPPNPGDGTTIPSAIAGIASPIANYNLAQVTVGGYTRPILGDDDVHLAIKASDLTLVRTVRVYFDVNPGAATPENHDFTQNYYFFEWHASDLIGAVQAANAGFVLPVRDSLPLINQPTTLPTTTTPLPFGGSIEKGGTIKQPPLLPVSTDPLGLGNNQWLDLTCKVSQLIHVGTETSRTLADVKRVEILISMQDKAAVASGAATTAVQIFFDTLYISGGFAPDTDGNPNPFLYRYSYRSSTTGAISNPSPIGRASVRPRRQRVILGAPASTDPQIDLVDWWRFGGVLVRWTYLGTSPNSSPGLNDDFADEAIADGKALEYDNFRPWPITDRPKSGTCTVAGTAIKQASGDLFVPSWAEGSTIIVNNRIYSLYGPPPTTGLLWLNENAGYSTTPIPFYVPSATLLAASLPVLFGGPIGGTVYTFACGDSFNPGALYWTKPNLPDMASDKNSLLVSTPSEPLQNGCMYDGLPYVFSTDNLYVIEPDFNAPSQFRVLITPCGRGLWCRWGFCVTPLGIAFIGKDGIYLTRAGAPAVSLTDKDLYPLFPHDGRPGMAVNGYNPPDMTQPTRLRLSYCDGWLYFDYLDTTGLGGTLALRMEEGSWWPDFYSTGDNNVYSRFWTTGQSAHDMIIGSKKGWIYHPDSTVLTDNGDPIVCIAKIVENQNDPRQQKLYRDVAVEMDMGASANLTIDFSLTNETSALPSASIAATTGRQTYYTSFDPTGMSAYGENLTITFTFSPLASATQSPRFFWYDIGFQLEPELATNWLSGPTTHGLPGYQQVPMVLMCYRSSGTATFNVLIDGVLYSYALPSTGGKYFKKFFRLQSVKGLTFQYGFQAPGQSAFQLFDIDCEVWVQPWGTPGYQKMKPFSVPGGAGGGGR